MALRDRSFAGPYPYSDSTPFKILAGNEKSMPLPDLMQVLDSIQRGQGSQYAAAMKGTVTAQVPELDTKCSRIFEMCLGRENNNYEKCIQTDLQGCLASSTSSEPNPTGHMPYS